MIVGDGAGLDRLQGIWAELWARTRPVPPMLEWSWVRTWWAAHAGEGQLLVIVVDGPGGHPIGIAPLYLRDEGLKHPRRCLRTVQFLGTGEREEDEVTGEYTTWLAAPEHMARVTVAVAAELERRRGEWDRLRLERTSAGSGIAEGLAAALRDQTLHLDRHEVAAFRTPVRPREAFLAALPSSNFRHRCRRALREGAERDLELFRARTADEAHELFAALMSLHQHRWEERGRPGVFASEVFTRFQQRMLDQYFPAGDGAAHDPARAHAWLVGLRERSNGRRWLAVRYLLRAGDTLYDYLSGVDTQGSAALAPGLLLHLHTIDACAESGIAVYDLMAGDYDYKRKLASEVDALPTLDLFARTVRSRLWLTARDVGRQLRAPVRATPPDRVTPAPAPSAQPAAFEP